MQSSASPDPYLRWGVLSGPWLIPIRLRILFVLDGRISTAEDPGCFGLGLVLNTLCDDSFSWWVRFKVDVVRRDDGRRMLCPDEVLLDAGPPCYAFSPKRNFLNCDPYKISLADDAEVSYRAFQLRVPKQQLNSPEILRAPRECHSARWDDLLLVAYIPADVETLNGSARSTIGAGRWPRRRASARPSAVWPTCRELGWAMRTGLARQ